MIKNAHCGKVTELMWWGS